MYLETLFTRLFNSNEAGTIVPTDPLIPFDALRDVENCNQTDDLLLSISTINQPGLHLFLSTSCSALIMWFGNSSSYVTLIQPILQNSTNFN